MPSLVCMVYFVASAFSGTARFSATTAPSMNLFTATWGVIENGINWAITMPTISSPGTIQKLVLAAPAQPYSPTAPGKGSDDGATRTEPPSPKPVPGMGNPPNRIGISFSGSWFEVMAFTVSAFRILF